MNPIGRQVRSALDAVSGRRTLSVLDFDQVDPADRDAVVRTVLEGRRVGDATFLDQWDGDWLRRTVGAGCVMFGAPAAGIASVVATQGESGTGGMFLLVFLPASLLGVRALNRQLAHPVRREPSSSIEESATVFSVTITRDDRVAGGLWREVRQVWAHACGHADALTAAELGPVRDLAYNAQAQLACMVRAGRQNLDTEAGRYEQQAREMLRRLQQQAEIVIDRAREGREHAAALSGSVGWEQTLRALGKASQTGFLDVPAEPVGILSGPERQAPDPADAEPARPDDGPTWSVYNQHS